MTPHTSTEQITNAVCARFLMVSGLSIEQLEAEIESLGHHAAEIELWNAASGTPCWMRQMDAARVERIRAAQAELLDELARKKLAARDVFGNLPRLNVGLKPGVFRSWRECFNAIFVSAALAAVLYALVWAFGLLLAHGFGGAR